MRIVMIALSALLFAVLVHFPAVAGPIHDAAKTGDTAQVKSLIAAGTAIDEMDALDKTALIWASENGHSEVVRVLVDMGADVNTEDFMGQTPLYWAARAMVGNKDIVEILITAGADVNHQDSQGTRPLDLPINKRDKAIAEMLRGAGAICGTNNDISRACNTGFDQSD